MPAWLGKALVAGLLDKVIVPLGQWLYRSGKRTIQRFKRKKKVKKFEETGNATDLRNIDRM